MVPLFLSEYLISERGLKKQFPKQYRKQEKMEKKKKTKTTSPDYRGIKIALEAAVLLGAESAAPGSASHPVLCIVLPTCLVAGKVSSSNLPRPHPAAGWPATIDSLPQAFLLLSCSCGIKAATGCREGGGHSLHTARGNFSCIPTFFNCRE